jgi:hypothetical protein
MIRKTLLGLVATFLLTRTAAAAPGWGQFIHLTANTVPNCVSRATVAIQSVTGLTPTVIQLDPYNTELRVSTANDDIFVNCTASALDLCPPFQKQEAYFNMLAVSSLSVADAASFRDRINTAFGSFPLTDCN